MCPPYCSDISASCSDPECASKCEFSCGDTTKCIEPCPTWCYFSPTCGLNQPDSNDKCNNCAPCAKDENQKPTATKNICPIAYFQDVTELKFPKSDTYWHQWRHSGRPYIYDGFPLLLDVNNDGILDYFSTMHAHPVDPKASCGYCERMEIGESVSYNFTLDGIHVEQTIEQQRASSGNSSTPATIKSDKTVLSYSNTTTMHRFRRASYRIIFDEGIVNMDPHGANMLDLDGDGFDDILIASGGDMGRPMDPRFQPSRDNFLFWGEPGIDPITGENTTFYRGGRPAARKAGVHMRMGRGRTNYVWDANGDGLLDIFMMADRRGDNMLTPGVLLINQGNRTWKPDPSMSEFVRTMILTDANGDGMADEIILNRGFCFPQRPKDITSTVKYNGPKLNETIRKKLGPFPAEVNKFCETRPVGTTAIFKYNTGGKDDKKMNTKIEGYMKDISPIRYKNVSPDDNKQPPCCPHGTWNSINDCNAVGFASGDLDGDLRADLVVLYKTKFYIYLSSDRPVGALPTDDYPKYRSAEVSLPYNYPGQSIFIVDLDNDGELEIFVACSPGPKFLIYTKSTAMSYNTNNDGDDDKSGNHRHLGGVTMDWTLENGCNTLGAKGDLEDYQLVGFKHQDYFDACDDEGWPFTTNACDQSKHMPKYPPAAADDGLKEGALPLSGISLSDFNNDGFLDIVAAYEGGYLRFFVNKIPEIRQQEQEELHQHGDGGHHSIRQHHSNRFIAFRLIGDLQKGVNMYGIGSTLILTTVEKESNEQNDGQPIIVKTKKLFREVNSYQHYSNHYSSRDDRIIFGLGSSMSPVSLLVRWPKTNKNHHNTEATESNVIVIDLRGWEFTTTLDPILVYYPDRANEERENNTATLISKNVSTFLKTGSALTLVSLILFVVFCFYCYLRKTNRKVGRLFRRNKNINKTAVSVKNDEIELLLPNPEGHKR